MIDEESVVNQNVIQDVVRLCKVIKNNSRFRTPYHPKLLQELLEIAVDCPEKPEDFKLDIGPIQRLHLLDEICLVSGGADSTIAWYLMGKPKAIYIDIGQSYASKEKHKLEILKIDPIIIDLYSTGIGNNGEKWKHIIPGRNFLFLTIAAEFLRDGGELIFSAVDGEGYNSGKGDKSQAFIVKWQEWYRALTSKVIGISTCVERTKAGWLKEFASRGNSLDIIRYNTITCFSDEDGQCGKCQACLRKYLSFMTNGLDIAEDFNIYPMIGAKEYVDKYKDVLSKALKLNNYSHYSLVRCTEDLAAIEKAEMRMK
jgi:7-cyano-7-deazaguanine synthase in queuosine biosynthesis